MGKKKKSENDANHGSNSIDTYFKKKAPAVVPVVTEDQKENDMGRASNHRVSGVKANKRKGQAKALKEKQKLTPAKKKQKTILGGDAAGRADEGDKTVCIACMQIAKNPNWKDHGHDITCPRSSWYKKLDGGRITKMEYHQREMAKLLAEANNKKFEGAELHTFTIKKSQADINKFVLEPRRAQQKISDSDLVGSDVESVADKEESGINPFSIDQLKERINHYMKNPRSGTMLNDSNSVPMVIGAAIETLLETQMIKCKKGSNELQIKTAAPQKLYDIYRNQFPPGTLGFTFPRDDKMKKPDHYYSQLEGRTIYLVRWELNVPGILLKCPCCTTGELIHQKYDFRMSKGFATALQGIEGETDWAVSMKYQCNECKEWVRANDGRLLATLPTQFRNAYPVDPRYAVTNATRHLKKSCTNVMDKFLISHGNGNQFCQLLSELKGENHLDYQEEYLSQARDTNTRVVRPMPTYKEFIGPYSPSGQDIRDLLDSAMQSPLNSTGVSEKERGIREMQGVGACKTTANDHTFKMISNWIAKEIDDAKCVHTIGVETGEIASAAIVPSVDQKYYAHQAEQFSRRPNVRPQVHVSDVCPNGTALWKKLFRNVAVCLGWFHFIQRISKTLLEGHRNYMKAIRKLQECLYWFDVGDLDKVKNQIAVGNLGRVDGQICPEEKRLAKAKTYRSNVRVYSYEEKTIQRNLGNWYEEFKDDLDPAIEADLFTEATESAVLQQIGNAEWVVDKLPREELYQEVAPGTRSKTNLKVFVGVRGAESKLEKGHDIMGHLGNTAMRPSLADSLGMIGVARYNRSIRYRLKIAKMDPEERKRIPICFQQAPHYMNHLRLTQINQLAAEVGLEAPPHSDVEILPEDNGERFFSEALMEHKKRDEAGVQYEDKTNRCMCKACGGRPNPYSKPRPIVPGAARTAPSLLKNVPPPAFQPGPGTVVEPTPVLPRPMAASPLVPPETPSVVGHQQAQNPFFCQGPLHFAPFPMHNQPIPFAPYPLPFAPYRPPLNNMWPNPPSVLPPQFTPYTQLMRQDKKK